MLRHKLDNFWRTSCADVFGPSLHPRDFADDTPYTYARFKFWVDATGKSPLLTAFIPDHIKFMLHRLRCTQYPLRVQQERKGTNRMPRSQRVCHICLASSGNHEKHVEDEHHFLIECPVYSEIRAEFPDVFQQQSTPHSILNHGDQARLGTAIFRMLLHRRSMLLQS